MYGHHVHGLETPHRDEHAIGIDTGCCFGGRLTAFVIDSGEVVQVAARRKYADLHDPDA